MASAARPWPDHFVEQEGTMKLGNFKVFTHDSTDAADFCGVIVILALTAMFVLGCLHLMGHV